MSQAEKKYDTPLSREEACLKNCVEGLGTEGLPRPMSRSERYLHALAEKLAGGGSGGASSWNDLTDKPFYDKTETVTEEMTVEWDGVVGDKTVVTFMEEGVQAASFVRISDFTFCADSDSIRRMSVTGIMGGSANITDGDTLLAKLIEGEGYACLPNIINIYEDNTYVDVLISGEMPLQAVFPKKGLYALLITANDVPALYVSEITGTFTGTATTVKTIDPKFLPDTIAPKELILTSSTEGSTKQFKITVVDNGTITATEVV